MMLETNEKRCALWWCAVHGMLVLRLRESVRPVCRDICIDNEISRDSRYITWTSDHVKFVPFLLFLHRFLRGARKTVKRFKHCSLISRCSLSWRWRKSTGKHWHDLQQRAEESTDLQRIPTYSEESTDLQRIPTYSEESTDLQRIPTYSEESTDLQRIPTYSEESTDLQFQRIQRKALTCNVFQRIQRKALTCNVFQRIQRKALSFS